MLLLQYNVLLPFKGTATSSWDVKYNGLLTSKVTADTHDAASIPKSHMIIYSHRCVSVIWSSKPSSRKLFQNSSASGSKHHALWVENQNLKKQKRRRKKLKKRVSSVKLGRNKDEGTLSEEHNVQEEDTTHILFG
ncbi:hypothetical protein Tco_0579069 [Tanacetum coccineum]